MPLTVKYLFDLRANQTLAVHEQEYLFLVILEAMYGNHHEGTD